MCEGGGINVSIICIVTLFLAEYCGFGWVVGTFFWVFWFCFGIAWRTGYPRFFENFGILPAPRSSAGHFAAKRQIGAGTSSWRRQKAKILKKPGGTRPPSDSEKNQNIRKKSQLSVKSTISAKKTSLVYR